MLTKTFTDARGRSVLVKSNVGAAETVIATSMGLHVGAFSGILKVTNGIISGATELVGAGVGLTSPRVNSRGNTSTKRKSISS
jgi:hypothetical protein